MMRAMHLTTATVVHYSVHDIKGDHDDFNN
jgi:hypothetical protein